MLALIWTLFIIVAVWLLLIRPQRRRVMQHGALVASLEVGHDVITAGGMHGRIAALDDEIAHLEVSPGVVVKIERRAIARDLTLVPPLADDGPSGPVSEA